VAPLLPKLRGHFAEFLNEGSPVRLRILYSSTCVGLGYGRIASSQLRSFLARRCQRLLVLRPGVTGVTRLPPPSTQRLALPTRSRFTPPPGTGMLTRCPSPTPFGLGLGPTHPTRTDLPSEPFDFRRTGFSPVFRYSCQHSHFWPLHRALSARLHRNQNAPLLLLQVPSFGGVLEPRYIFRAVAFDQ
jgi:hypothetical protein